MNISKVCTALVIGLSLLQASCEGGAQSVTSTPETIKPDRSTSLDLRILGLEEAVFKSATQGRDKSFTLSLYAFSSGPEGKSKPTVLYTQKVEADDLLLHPFTRMSPDDAQGETSVSVIVPSESTELEVKILGEQSGVEVSEKMVSSGAEESALLVSVYALPNELTNESSSLPLGINLYAPVDNLEETGGKRKGKVEDGGQIQLFSVDPVDGTIRVSKRLQAGYGGTGTESVASAGGTVQFANPKGGEDVSAYVQKDDGSLKPVQLPPSSSGETVVDSPDRRTLYALDSQENRLLVYRREADGTLQEIGRLSTGPNPIALAMVAQANLLVIAEYEGRALSTFTIDAQGNLSPYRSITTEANPLAIAIDPAGRFLYLSETNQTISQFSISSDRTLTLRQRVNTPTTVTTMRMDPLGAVLSALTYSEPGCGEDGSKCKHKETWRKFRGAVVSIVVQAVVVVAVSYVSCSTFQAWTCKAALAYGEGVQALCKDSWKEGRACYGYRRTWNSKPDVTQV